MDRRPPSAVRSPPRWLWALLALWLVGSGVALWSLSPYDPSRAAVCSSSSSDPTR